MARINIKDLPGDIKISKEEMRKVFGGDLSWTPGVLLLESAKYNTQTTAVSNISGIGTKTIQARKIVERKMTA